MWNSSTCHGIRCRPLKVALDLTPVSKNFSASHASVNHALRIFKTQPPEAMSAFCKVWQDVVCGSYLKAFTFPHRSSKTSTGEFPHRWHNSAHSTGRQAHIFSGCMIHQPHFLSRESQIFSSILEETEEQVPHISKGLQTAILALWIWWDGKWDTPLKMLQHGLRASLLPERSPLWCEQPGKSVGTWSQRARDQIVHIRILPN